MYDPLMSVAKDLNELDVVLGAKDASDRIAKIVSAFDETAERISSATQSVHDSQERIEMQKLYRGMIAARRIVLNLQERRSARG
ncbi:type III secretion system protein [Paraburkholderia sp. NMBU_R16]|nr:type III secretion system protein [Paraburkholderia sp. NMBU_R16]